MWKLLIYLKDYKKESILAPLFKMLEAAFELLIPIVMKHVVDQGIAGGDRHYVYKMCLLMILLGLIGLVCSITAQYFSAKAAVGFATKLRHGLFTHLSSLSYTEFDALGTSAMITRMTSDINQVQSGVNLVLRLFLRSPFIVVGAMIMAFTQDARSALIFVVTVPLLALVVFGVMLASIPLFRKVQETLDRIVSLTRWNLTGVRVIRAFTREEEEVREFTKENRGLTALQLYVGKISAVMNPATYVIVNTAVAGLLWYGGIRVNTGAFKTGTVIALVNYMSQILVELIKLANLIITVTKAIACGNRIQSVFEMTNSLDAATDGRSDADGARGRTRIDGRSDVDGARGRTRIDGRSDADGARGRTRIDSRSDADGVRSQGWEEAAVRFCHVSLTYQGAGMPALTDIDFTAGKGQTIGIIGGTGSGKSSVVNLIPRFYDATEGTVLVNGENVRDYPARRLDELRNKIGVVPQKAVLFSGTIRENMQWGRKDAKDSEIWEALRIAQAADFVEQKEGGLDYIISQNGKNLSGGQRQRLTIARALVRKPEILILDDSSSALDYATDAALRNALRNMKEKPTVFVVSQRTSSMQDADCILVLEGGKIAGMGTHEELLASNTIYQEIHYSQFPKQIPGRKGGQNG